MLHITVDSSCYGALKGKFNVIIFALSFNDIRN